MFTFDPVAHQYLHGTMRVQSVTSLIKAAGLLGPAAAFYAPEHANRGTRVHRACLDLDLGNDISMEHDEALYLDSYSNWRDLTQPVWTSMEEPKLSERYNLAGTADRLGWISGRPVIVDFKTGGPASWHGLQLALYDLLYDDLPPMIRRRLVLHLRKDGRLPQVVEYADQSDYSTAFNLIKNRSADNDTRNTDAEPQAESRTEHPNHATCRACLILSGGDARRKRRSVRVSRTNPTALALDRRHLQRCQISSGDG